MPVDTSQVVAAISDGQASTIVVALAACVAIWSIKAVKLLRDDGGLDADFDPGEGEPCGCCGAESYQLLGDVAWWCGDADCEYNLLCRRCGENYVEDSEYRICPDCEHSHAEDFDPTDGEEHF